MKFEIANVKPIVETNEFGTFCVEFDRNIDFLEDFSDLIDESGRMISFISDKGIYQVNTGLLNNSVQTLKSIKLCCSIGSFTDANTLTRKLRDDLILFVYILEIVNKRKPFIEEDIKKMDLNDIENFVSSVSNIRFNANLTDDEKAVEAWLGNNVLALPKNIKKKLSFENYMKFLTRNECITNILANYNLQDYWETLRNKLNNYVHNNGRQFTSHNVIRGDNEHLEVYLKNINIRTSYILTVFLVLIIMVDGTLISSSDMIDCLENGIEPPEGCQYEVANFIQDYIDLKVVALHPELKQYLSANNKYGMRIK